MERAFALDARFYPLRWGRRRDWQGLTYQVHSYKLLQLCSAFNITCFHSCYYSIFMESCLNFTSISQTKQIFCFTYIDISTYFVFDISYQMKISMFLNGPHNFQYWKEKKDSIHEISFFPFSTELRCSSVCLLRDLSVFPGQAKRAKGGKSGIPKWRNWSCFDCGGGGDVSIRSNLNTIVRIYTLAARPE